MTKVVLDTNIFISALFWKGLPYRVFKMSLKGEILNFISPPSERIFETKLIKKNLIKFRNKQNEESGNS